MTTIGNSAFKNCISLTSINIPNSVVGRLDHTFNGCTGLTSIIIPNGINEISNAFIGCTNLSSISIPDSVLIISNSSFDGCNGSLFDSSTIPGMKLVDGWIVSNTTSPSGVLNLAGIRGIVGRSFYNCTGITGIVSSTIFSIGESAFSGCTNLANINLPNIKYIGDDAFYSTSFYDNASDGLLIIGKCLYDRIGSSLINITIPIDVVSISDFCNLTGTNITILGQVINIGTRSLTGVNSPIIFQNMTISQVQDILGDINFGFGETVTVTCSDGSFTITTSCLLKGTDILLSDGTTKKIEDLTYDDNLKVWDFDEGQLGSAKVCWLIRPGCKNSHYYQLTFNDGTVLKTTGINSNHRIYSVDQNKFTNVSDAKVGDKVFSIDGVLTITDVQKIDEECEYYNVMTSGKINCFANGILTSDRYGNMYPIDVNMKYDKTGRTIRHYSEYEAVGIERYWYDNLRLGEVNETVEKSLEYVMKCRGHMLPLPNGMN